VPGRNYLCLPSHGTKTQTSSSSDSNSFNPAEHCSSCNCLNSYFACKSARTFATASTNGHLTTSASALLRPIDS
jgi:hypothetical protein